MVERKQSAGGGALSDSAAQTGIKMAPASHGGCAFPAVVGQSTALPLRAGSITMAALIDLYMTAYAGRDVTRLQRLGWWAVKLGDISLQDLSDDQVHAALDDLADQPGRF